MKMQEDKMEELTFGEQVKIILGRKGMTIKELAELIEQKTGMKMSRQNLTQRLGRDNFQEQDMRMIASILECPFHLSIMDVEGQSAAKEELEARKKEQESDMQQMELPLEEMQVNPYQSSSVRMHPTRSGYVQVYQRETDDWVDMTEWAFLRDQEQKKAMLREHYLPPVYVD